jgi:hypothetical protein
VLRGSVNGSGKADEECVCGMYSHSFMVRLGDEPTILSRSKEGRCCDRGVRGVRGSSNCIGELRPGNMYRIQAPWK